MTLPTTPERDAARGAYSRTPVRVLYLYPDRCQNTFSVAPCTASGPAGSECYNTFKTCQDKPNYNRGSQLIAFSERGAPLPPGELVRPYITRIQTAPTKIGSARSLAARGMVRVTLIDEPDNDVQIDPYAATRTNAPSGTFWQRLLSRNPYLVGRRAVLRDGYVTEPWDWNTFVDEEYIVERVEGPNGKGEITLILKDPLAKTDRIKLPIPTDGKAQEALKAVYHSGRAQAGSTNSITLSSAASTQTDIYVGMSIKAVGGRGTGQEATCTAYNGATKVLAFTPAVSVAFDDTTDYEIGQLSLTLDSGKGAQYPDPAVTGRQEYFQMGSEIIRYTSISGDTLSWTSQDHRAQFGSTRSDHKVNDNVQYCLSFVNETVTDVIRRILNDSGISDANIDLTQFSAQEQEYFGPSYRITTAFSDPNGAAALLYDLLNHINAVQWWSNVEQRVKLQQIAPLPPSVTIQNLTDQDGLIHDSVMVQRLDDLRITEAYMRFALADKAGSRKEGKSYVRGQRRIDGDAESANEWGDIRPYVVYSRWFNAENENAARAFVARKLAEFRDPPSKVKFQVDPKDYEFTVADQVDLTTSKLPDWAGAPQRTRVFITSVRNRGDAIEYEGQTTNWASKRIAFIAPDTAGDYPSDPNYGHISDNSGLMSDGTEGYRIW